MYNFYKNMLLNNFTILNDNKIDFSLEKQLFEYGEVAFFYDNVLGVLHLPFITLRRDIYGEPTKIQVFSVSYNKVIEDFIIMKNTPNATRFNVFLKEKTDIIKQLEKIKDVLYKRIKQPYILNIKDKNITKKSNDYHNIKILIDNGESVINTEYENIDIDKIDLPINFTLEDINNEINYIKQDIERFIGIFSSVEKKERLITSEQESSNDVPNSIYKTMLNSRLISFVLINKKFNCNFTLVENE